MAVIPRKQYTDLFGPTVGDKVQLADTNLIIEIEKDYAAASYGDEIVYGGGKSARDGMGADPLASQTQGALDLVITNAVVMDPIIGIVKADIGVKDGLIAASASPATRRRSTASTPVSSSAPVPRSSRAST
jgi:urease subunit alpha